MQKRLAELEARVASLSEAVHGLSARVAVLEAPAVAVSRPSEMSGPASAEAVVAEAMDTTEAILPLVGRTFLVLGGGFLFRALTESGTLAGGAGVGLGLLYALLFGILADRAEGAAHRWSATFHGLSSAMIALPLLWEATVRLAILSPRLAPFLLAGVTAFLLAVAFRREVQALAWAVAFGSIATAFGLLVATHAVATLSLVLIALGVGVLWMTYGRRWHLLRWPFALAADTAVALMVQVAAHPGGLPEGYEDLSIPGVLTIALALPVVYLGSFALRTLARQRSVNPFEIVQTVLALLAGFGGAVRVAGAAGFGSTTLGLAALLLALACYVVAFAFVERREEFRVNFLFYSTLALLLTLSVSPLVAGGTWLVLFWSALAVAAALLASRVDRLSLEAHASAYALAAAAISGFLGAALRAFVSPTLTPAPSGAAGIVVLASSVAAFVVISALSARSGGARTWREMFPAGVLGLLSVLGVGAWTVHALSGLVLGGGNAPARLAAIRTGVLAVAAVALAFSRRYKVLDGLSWLAYPVLVAGGFKLLFEDFRAGGAAALVISFGFYGAALILVPRLQRAGKAAGPASP